MSKPNAPCFMCKERKPGCHSVCEKYITYSQDNLEYINIVASEKHKFGDYAAFRKQGAIKVMRSRGK